MRNSTLMAAERFDISDIEGAIADEQIFLDYQPKIDLMTGDLVGVEALARWRRPMWGVIEPDAFIPVIADGDMMKPFSAGVLRAAAREAALWTGAGHDITVAVNIGPRLLDDLDLPDRFQSVVDAAGLSPRSVVVEITETGLVADMPRAMEVMARLRLKGFELSLDDFGTGNSSLVQLHYLPFNELKIDRSFVSQVTRSRDAAVIVRAVIELAHNLGLSTCAEGVEDRATHDFLLDVECDHGQGFYYGRPGHPDDIAGRLARKVAAPV